jgi:hypothetical protein
MTSVGMTSILTVPAKQKPLLQEALFDTGPPRRAFSFGVGFTSNSPTGAEGK